MTMRRSLHRGWFATGMIVAVVTLFVLPWTVREMATAATAGRFVATEFVVDTYSVATEGSDLVRRRSRPRGSGQAQIGSASWEGRGWRSWAALDEPRAIGRTCATCHPAGRGRCWIVSCRSGSSPRTSSARPRRSACWASRWRWLPCPCGASGAGRADDLQRRVTGRSPAYCPMPVPKDQPSNLRVTDVDVALGRNGQIAQ